METEVAAEIEAVVRRLEPLEASLRDISSCLQRILKDLHTEPSGRDGGDVLLNSGELANILGYSRATLKAMRARKSPLLAGLEFFKLCGCGSTRRLTQSKCNHSFYVWRSDVEAFLRRRQEQFQNSRG